MRARVVIWILVFLLMIKETRKNMKLKKLLALLLSATLLTLTLASCNDTKKPVPIVCGEAGMNELCGIATYGVDYYNLGVQAGNMAADILLDGISPATMPVGGDPNPALIVNKDLATEIGFTIPQSILDRASGSSTQTVTRNESVLKAESETADFTVGILQLVQHVALDQSNEGFVDQLSVRMAAASKTVKILDRNAQNDQSNNVTIATQFNTQGVDLMYAIATSSAQACATATAESKIPVLFCAVTDPVDADLIASLDAPGGNVSGVSDMNPVADQIELINELLGGENVKIGFLYTAGEQNSVTQITLAKNYCNQKGYAYVEGAISDINDLSNAMTTLKTKGVTAIYVPTDNVLANGSANIHICNTSE